jgi:DNA-binding FadR family transcriptional regulator
MEISANKVEALILTGMCRFGRKFPSEWALSDFRLTSKPTLRVVCSYVGTFNITPIYA